MALGRDLLIRSLVEHEPIDQADIDATIELFTEGKRRLNLKSVLLFSILEGMTPVVSRANDTFWVQLDALRLALLGLNDKFARALGPEQVTFVLAHEMLHLLLKHLYVDDTLRKDRVWTYACEATINYWVAVLLGSPAAPRPMPQIVNPDSGKLETTGVDWNEVHKKVVKGCKDQGIEAPSVAELYATDLGCVDWLKRAKVDPPQQQQCSHMLVESGAGDGEPTSGGAPTLDAGGLADLVENAIGRTVGISKGDGEAAKRAAEELGSLQDLTGGSDSAARIWGSTGARTGRGGASEPLKRTQFWRDLVAHKLWERMQDDFKLLMLRKRVDDCVLAFRGQSEYSRGSVYTDASGSMHDKVLSVLATLVGQTDELIVDWHSWDGSVKKYTPGDPAWLGGGGTTFDCIVAHLQDGILDDGTSCDCDAPNDEPDWVLIVTDGLAAPTRFEAPERVVVLLVPGGDPNPLVASGVSPDDIVRLTQEDIDALAEI